MWERQRQTQNEREGKKETKQQEDKRHAEAKQQRNKDEMTREKEIKRKKGRRGNISTRGPGAKRTPEGPTWSPRQPRNIIPIPKYRGMGYSAISPVNCANPPTPPTTGNESS